MGAACCCLRDNFEDLADANSSIYRNCICLPYFFQNFFHMYASVLRSGEQHGISSSTQATTASMSSTASHDNSMSELYCAPPRPLPYDADQRYFRLQQNELVPQRKKGLQRSNSDDDTEFTSPENKLDRSGEEVSKEGYSSSVMKLLNTKPTAGFAHTYPSEEEEEDVCPTCLDEYDEENPKIITKCSHHFHLSCIYEWMERSENCPVCGKVMAFDEMT